MLSIKQIQRKIINQLSKKKYKIISFDVFDTLLHRTCPPEAVLDAVNQYVLKEISEFSLTCDINYISNQRTIAYLELANQNALNGYDQETHVDDFFPLWMKLVGVPEKEINNFSLKILEYEFYLEKQVIVSDPTMLEFLKYLKKFDIKIIFSSDMYLSQKFIEYLLKENNLLEYFDFGYVSSEIKLLKRSGKLFDFIVEKEKILYRELLHIGDNVNSDYIQPSKKGIKSYWLCESEQMKRRNMLSFDYKNIDNKYAQSLLLNELGGFFASTCTIPYMLGRTVFGPIYTYFIVKAITRAKELKIDKVYFLAREGYILKSIYDQLSKVYTDIPPSVYMAASRLVCLLYSIDKGIEPRHLNDIYSNISLFTVENILAPFDIPYNLLVEATERQGIKYDEILPANFVEWHPFIRLCEDEKLNEFIVSKAKQHAILFNEYLDKIGLEKGERVMLIDVGWGGQIQDNLYKGLVLNNREPGLMVGYYLALNEKAHQRKQSNNWMEWAISDKGFLEWNSTISFDTVFIYEAAVRASHGTVIGFERDHNHKVIPKLKDTNSLSRTIELIDDPSLAQLQNGIFDFSVNILISKQLYSNIDLLSLEYIARSSMGIMGRFPDQNIYNWMSNIGNVADLGSHQINKAGTDNFKWYNFYQSVRKAAWKEYVTFNVLGFIGVLILNTIKYSKKIPSNTTPLVTGITIHSIANEEYLSRESKLGIKVEDDFYTLAHNNHINQADLGYKKLSMIGHFGKISSLSMHVKNYIIFKVINKVLLWKKKHLFYYEGVSIKYMIKRHLESNKKLFIQKLKAVIKR